MTKERVYSACGISGTVKEFAAQAGVGNETMRQRLNKFVLGKFSEDKLLSGEKTLKNGGGCGNLSWKSLSNRQRDENLRNIPPPTPFDLLAN